VPDLHFAATKLATNQDHALSKAFLGKCSVYRWVCLAKQVTLNEEFSWRRRDCYQIRYHKHNWGKARNPLLHSGWRRRGWRFF